MNIDQGLCARGIHRWWISEAGVINCRHCGTVHSGSRVKPTQSFESEVLDLLRQIERNTRQVQPATPWKVDE